MTQFAGTSHKSIRQVCSKDLPISEELSLKRLDEGKAQRDSSSRYCQSKKETVKEEASEENEALEGNEKFELLSAYIDGEVSESDRQKVEKWLVSDAQIQQQYKTQLKLSQALKSVFRQD